MGPFISQEENLSVSNALAYVVSFIVLAPVFAFFLAPFMIELWPNYIKLFTAVIYKCLQNVRVFVLG